MKGLEGSFGTAQLLEQGFGAFEAPMNDGDGPGREKTRQRLGNGMTRHATAHRTGGRGAEGPQHM